MDILNKIMITQIYVRYYETDRMKIVHHSNYFRYFELGRCEFFSKKIVPYSVLEEKYGILSPLLSACAKFFKPLKFEDIFYIATFIKNFSGIKITFGYLATKNDQTIDKLFSGNLDLLTKDVNSVEDFYKRIDEVVCIGETKHTFVDYKNFLPLRPKIFIEEKGEKLDNIINNLLIRY